ncbi:MAG: hypothetical protein ACNA77_03170 [Opitutales bacterium]
MKTTDPRDPLDQKIDQLLASQPSKVPTNFAARTLARLEQEREIQGSGRSWAPLIRFALPLAAALALAFVVFSQLQKGASENSLQVTNLANSDTGTDQELTSYEIQEILLLQEGLSAFAQIETEELNGSDLFDTLETLYSI